MWFFVFLGVPILAVLSFLVSLIDFLVTPKDSVKRENKKTLVIILGVIAGIFVVLIISIMLLFMLAIANM